MVTAYDEPSARYCDAAGVDIILVGDSMANVVMGQSDTMHVTMEEMIHHVRAVAAANPKAHVVADMPWMSYHVDVSSSVRNAAALVRAGAQSVKLEGGRGDPCDGASWAHSPECARLWRVQGPGQDA
jgi:3-methyl-2-oxobutanoate hydroxymethyltransferase